MLVLGAIGLLVCLAALAGVWTVELRVERATQQLFAHVDRSLTGARDRLTDLSQRVQSATISVREFEQDIQEWAATETRQRAAERLKLREKAQRQSATLEQAERRLEASQSSLEVARDVLQLARGFGMPVDVESMESFTREIQALRARFQEARETAGSIGGPAAGEERRLELQEQRQQALRSVRRVAATLTSLDEKLAELEASMATTQGRLAKLKQQTLGWIRLAAVALTAGLCWMALGQGALCFLGGSAPRRLRRTPS